MEGILTTIFGTISIIICSIIIWNCLKIYIKFPEMGKEFLWIMVVAANLIFLALTYPAIYFLKDNFPLIEYSPYIFFLIILIALFKTINIAKQKYPIEIKASLRSRKRGKIS